MIVSILFLLLACYVAAEAIHTKLVVEPRRRANGQPTLGDIFTMRNVKLDINAHATMARYEIMATLKRGGWMALDREIRKRFSGGSGFTDWSIDYCYPHYDYHGRRQPGQWTKRDSVSEATIYFYNRRVPAPPPAPPPPPEPKPLWTEEEERQRIESFLAGPSAFWLNPDWDKARETGEPFWMFDPAPIPSRFQPVDSRIRQIAEMILRDGITQTLDYRTLRDPPGQYVVYLYGDEGEEIKVKSKDYRAAQRLAQQLSQS